MKWPQTTNKLTQRNKQTCSQTENYLKRKSKRLIKLSKDVKETKNIDTVISSYKPPIFWKDKEIVKLQIKNWSYENIEKLIYEINEVELLIKKYSNSSINILYDFIIKQSTNTSN